MAESPKILKNQIGMRVLRRRQELGLTQEEVAARLGVSAPNVARIEHGRQNVTVDMMCRVAEALETTVQELMFGTTASK
jgi:transcriptional regulator with XRE-family HTH domain